MVVRALFGEPSFNLRLDYVLEPFEKLNRPRNTQTTTTIEDPGPPAGLKVVNWDFAHGSRRITSRAWNTDPFLKETLRKFVLEKKSIVQLIQNSSEFKVGPPYMPLLWGLGTHTTTSPAQNQATLRNQGGHGCGIHHHQAGMIPECWWVLGRASGSVYSQAPTLPRFMAA
jgi:hypothetical protein